MYEHPIIIVQNKNEFMKGEPVQFLNFSRPLVIEGLIFSTRPIAC